MKYIKFLLVGILFGIILSKSEVVSWYRIYEMFKFQAFHMYGVIGSAVIIGVILIQLFNRGVIKDFQGNPIKVKAKKKGFIRNFVGGSIFWTGLGVDWSLSWAYFCIDWAWNNFYSHCFVCSYCWSFYLWSFKQKTSQLVS